MDQNMVLYRGPQLSQWIWSPMSSHPVGG